MKYPRIFFLGLTYIAAVVILKNANFALRSSTNLVILTGETLIAGFLYAFSFTAALATVMLVTIGGDYNILILTLVAGCGALMGDIFIYRCIKHSMACELSGLFNEKWLWSVKTSYKKIPAGIILLLSAILISSPLPTELGVALMTKAKLMTFRQFAMIALILHTLGIFAVLLIGKTG